MSNQFTAPNAIVAVLDSYAQAEASLMQLGVSGFEMSKVSVAARDYQPGRQVAGCYGERGAAKYWGQGGEFWTGAWRALSGWAIFWRSEGGPLLVAGPLSGWIKAACENSAVFGGLDPLGAALYGLGIPREAVLRCESAVRAEKILLVAHGAAEDISKARQILNESGRQMRGGAGQAWG
jgi:hypothetical protein